MVAAMGRALRRTLLSALVVLAAAIAVPFLVPLAHFIPGLERLVFESIGGAGEGTVLNLIEHGLSDATRLREASYGSIRAATARWWRGCSPSYRNGRVKGMAACSGSWSSKRRAAAVPTG